MNWGSVRFPSRIARDMPENRRDDHLLSREAASPVGGDAMAGRGELPRPESGRGVLPRPALGQGEVPRPAPGRGVLPWSELVETRLIRVALVVPTHSSLSFASGEMLTFMMRLLSRLGTCPRVILILWNF
ncbi:UNVERIFIED_CONTAM: hypothetical protein Sradi_0485300 [Sesamum radiatum]|uniref:Uncharacterized protein n=1 Tax=Sesamum radiatum TaxID=300843 RepID=A0AAW2W8V2_SESRA